MKYRLFRPSYYTGAERANYTARRAIRSVGDVVEQVPIEGPQRPASSLDSRPPDAYGRVVRRHLGGGDERPPITPEP